MRHRWLLAWTARPLLCPPPQGGEAQRSVYRVKCKQPRADGFSPSPERPCDVAHRRQVGEGVEPPMLGNVLRRPDEPAPGGAGERAADADPLDAEILELTLGEARPAGKHIDWQLAGDAHDLRDFLRRLTRGA